MQRAGLSCGGMILNPKTLLLGRPGAEFPQVYLKSASQPEDWSLANDYAAALGNEGTGLALLAPSDGSGQGPGLAWRRRLCFVQARGRKRLRRRRRAGRDGSGQPPAGESQGLHCIDHDESD